LKSDELKGLALWTTSIFAVGLIAGGAGFGGAVLFLEAGGVAGKSQAFSGSKSIFIGLVDTGRTETNKVIPFINSLIPLAFTFGVAKKSSCKAVIEEIKLTPCERLSEPTGGGRITGFFR
jgi:hypothetical protein